jgi:hypothetical protein
MMRACVVASRVAVPVGLVPAIGLASMRGERHLAAS